MPASFSSVLAPGVRVLDIGCGPVKAAREVLAAGARYTGVDLNTASLLEAKSADPALRLVQGDANRLPFADGSFDLVFLRAVLTVVPLAAARQRIVAEAARVSRAYVGIYDFLQTWDQPLYAARYKAGLEAGMERGGFLVIDEDKFLFAARHFTRDEIEELAARAGATAVDVNEGPARTRSGNLIRGIAFLARKEKSESAG